MTKEEAIKVLSESIHDGSKVPWDKIVEAVHLSIEALSKPSLPSNLDEAAFSYENNLWESGFKECGYSPQEVSDAFRAGAKWRNAQIPKLPDSLNEAAEEYALDVKAKPFGNLVKNAFKAGAEWMAGQGETIDGEIITTSDYGWEDIRIPKKLYPLGTKVTIQIRKKQ